MGAVTRAAAQATVLLGWGFWMKPEANRNMRIGTTRSTEAKQGENNDDR
jgi:hypothetical protein